MAKGFESLRPRRVPKKLVATFRQHPDKLYRLADRLMQGLAE